MMHITCAEFVRLDPCLTGQLTRMHLLSFGTFKKVAHKLRKVKVLNIIHNLHYEGTGQSIIIIMTIITIIKILIIITVITIIIIMMIMTIIIITIIAITIIVISCTIKIINNVK